MYARIDGSELDLFKSNGRIVVAGASESGKSFFTSQLIRKYNSKFDEIIVIGSNLENIDDIKNIKHADEEYDAFSDDISDITNQKLVVYDDSMHSKKALANCARLFNSSRHKNINSILITQNLFHDCKYFRMTK